MSTETMSSNPSDWTQFYQQNLSNQVLPPGRTTLSGSMFGDRVADATVVTTTITSATTPTPLGSGNSSSSAVHLSPEGRVSKPIRRRSRASRRTPTTLLNTDTTNFRAMVQQFTGGPSAPFATSGSQLNAPNFNFGLQGSRQVVHVNPSSALMMPPGYHLQFQNQPYQQQSQASSYMFSLGNNNNINPGSGDMFLHRLGQARPTNMEVSDGFVTEGVSALQVAPPSRAAPSSSNENRSNTFLF